MEKILIPVFEWLNILATAIALVIGIKHRNKKYLYPVTLYLIVSFANNVILKIVEHFIDGRNFAHRFAAAEMNIYSIMEISLITYFIYTRLRGHRFRILTLISCSCYIVFCFTVWGFTKNAFTSTEPALYGLENFLITIPCLFYFHELIKTDLKINFTSDDTFVVLCAAFFYFSISMPFYFLSSIIHHISSQYYFVYSALNLTGYSILFILLTNAYLCPYQEQKS